MSTVCNAIRWFTAGVAGVASWLARFASEGNSRGRNWP
jgi:hypothetical protein